MSELQRPASYCEQQLIKRIIGGSYAAGSSLPSERELAQVRANRDVLNALLKAEQRLDLLRSEFNGGVPQKQGGEIRNPGLYQNRVDNMRTEIARAESEVSRLKVQLREMGVGIR